MLHVMPAAKPAFKHKVSVGKGKCPPSPACGGTLAVLGKTVQVTIPAGAAIDADRVFWEVDRKRRDARVDSKGDQLTCHVPDDIRPGSHLWLGIPSQANTLWIDFIAVDDR